MRCTEVGAHYIGAARKTLQTTTVWIFKFTSKSRYRRRDFFFNLCIVVVQMHSTRNGDLFIFNIIRYIYVSDDLRCSETRPSRTNEIVHTHIIYHIICALRLRIVDDIFYFEFLLSQKIEEIQNITFDNLWQQFTSGL
jgi:hypothetical protein